MKIVIVGAGSVGAAVCFQLAGEGHDITLIDSSSETVAEITNRCDVVGIEGNGANIGVLKKAGAEKADLLIALSFLKKRTRIKSSRRKGLIFLLIVPR